MEHSEKISTIIRHIHRVEDNCCQLAKKLPEDMGRKLVQLGRIHDASKFDNYEFEHLFDKQDPCFSTAIAIHHSKNPHHPEYWSSIHEMPDIYLAEMVCDCVARSQEFGDDARTYLFEVASKRFNFTIDDKCGQKISEYLNLLLTPKFT